MGLSDKTVRSYLDILTGTFMVRQLQPWHENLNKRQVKSPKVYFRDSGLLHRLLEIDSRRSLLAHPRAGASFEGFVIEQVLRTLTPAQAYFWASHGGAELDLFFLHNGKRWGVEVKFSEAPTPTRSMRTAIHDLALDHLFVIYPGEHRYAVEKDITMWPVRGIPDLKLQVDGRGKAALATSSSRERERGVPVDGLSAMTVRRHDHRRGQAHPLRASSKPAVVK